MKLKPHSRSEMPSNGDGHGHDMARRKFLGTLTGALAAGLVVQILGCTDTDFGAEAGAPVQGGPCPQPDKLSKAAAAANRTGTISANHGHAATVTGVVQEAGEAHTLDIQGTSPHNHTVALTTTDIYDLRTGAQVTTTSSNAAGHTHEVTFALLASSTPDKTGGVSANHGHEALVTGVLQDSEAGIALRIQGSANHNHLVSLTAQDLADIKAGLMVSKETSPDETGHGHTVTFSGVTSIIRPC